MTAEEMWAAYTRFHPTDASYDAWAFGIAADELADLVLQEKKTATSSAWPLYGLAAEALPEAGEYSVILNAAGEAVCIIRTTDVTVKPFCDVDAAYAALEGEGDLSLDYWRRMHRTFFAAALARAGLVFNEVMPVVCETFELVYPARGRKS